eukprot:gene5517-6872_t
MKKISIVEGDKTFILRENTVNQLLSESVKNFKDKTAFIFENCNNEVTKTSFKEFESMVNSVSVGFIEIGIRKGDFIGVYSIDSLKTIVCLFALQKIGAVTVNMFPSFGANEVQEIILETNCKGVIISNGINDMDQSGLIKEFITDLSISESNSNEINSKLFPNLKLIISVDQEQYVDKNKNPYLNYSSVKNLGDELLKNGFKLGEYESLVSCYDPSQILFSSGSTGKQKMILHNQFSFVNNTFFYPKIFNLNENDVFGNLGPIYAGNGKQSILASIIIGATMVYLPFDSSMRTQLIESIEKYSISVIQGSPSTFNSIINNPRIKQVNIKSLKKGMITGFHCKSIQAKEIKNLLGMEQCIHGYGMSEILLATSTFHDSPIDTFIYTVGSVLPHSSIKIIDSDCNIVPIGEIGQLCIKSFSVLMEYYRDPKKTKESFINGWFKTGDFSKIDENGNITIIGRMDDIIKSNGYMISPKEIEDFLITHPKIKDVQVFGIPNQQWGEAIVAWIILKNSSDSLLLDEITSYFKGKLSIKKTPKFIEIVTEFPLNRNLKPLKRIMRDITIKKLSSSSN